MNPLIQLKQTAPLLLITLTLHCFALLPQALAVVPPPDGGYPGFNTAEGQNALLNLTTGSANTAVGWFSLSLDATGSFNTATGAGTLLFNTGDQNTAFGAAALLLNTTSTQNTAVGTTALLNNTTGNANTATGAGALYSNTEGFSNTATGAGALHSNTEGHDNTAVGLFALLNSTGSSNTAIGTGAGASVTTAANVICIGDNGANVSDSCYIGKIYGTSIDPATTLAVGMDASHRLGTAVSSERFKRDIQPMENASEAILALKPVKFHYKSDVKSIPCFGLVAEDVEKVNPDLVVRDKNGEPLSVRYEQINAMLLNEFLKAHRTVQEQKATIAQLKSTDAKQEATIAKQQKQIEALTAGLQKVSDQLELSQAEPEVAINNP
jgi:trimeric autotransporter adhesin